MATEEYLNRLLAMVRLARQSEELERRLRTAWLVEGNDDRCIRLERIYRRSLDRTSRRADACRRFRQGLPAVTTAQVAAWVYGRVAVCGIVIPDPVELAGEACEVFGLWDEHGSIPGWVHGVCERTAPRAQMEIMRRRSFFVEKKLNYELDGNILWA